MRKNIAILRDHSRRPHEICPLHFTGTVLLKCQIKSRERSGNARRTVADCRTAFAADQLAFRIDKNVTRRRFRGHLTVIDGKRLAVLPPDHHKPAAADVPRLRINDRQRDPDRDRRIHRIPATLEHIHADLRREFMLRSHHRVLSASRLRSRIYRNGSKRNKRQRQRHKDHMRKNRSN